MVDPFSDIMPLAQEDKIIQFSLASDVCSWEPSWNLVKGESGHKNWLCSHTQTDAHLLTVFPFYFSLSLLCVFVARHRIIQKGALVWYGPPSSH